MAEENFFYIINPKDVIVKASKAGIVAGEYRHVDLRLLVGRMDNLALLPEHKPALPTQLSAWEQDYKKWKAKYD